MVAASAHRWPVLSGLSQNSVLIVEDDRDFREMLTLYLEFCGYVVHVASDGAEAIKIAGRVHPHIILMDLMMQRMDGLEATRRLKADALTSDITIVALSARSQGDEDHVARDAGCDAFISKPCNLEHLAAILRDFFHRRARALGTTVPRS